MKRLISLLVFTLLILCSAVIGNKYLLDKEFERGEKFSILINQSGKQRMLCQKAARYALSFEEMLKESNTIPQGELEELKELILSWNNLHQAILNRDKAYGFSGKNCQEVFLVFVELQAPFSEIMKAGQAFLQTPDLEQARQFRKAILFQDAQYLQLVERLIKHFEIEQLEESRGLKLYIIWFNVTLALITLLWMSRLIWVYIRKQSESEQKLETLNGKLKESRLKVNTSYKKNRHLEQKIITVHDQYKSIVEQVGELILEIDPRGNITYANPALKQKLGYSPEYVINQNFIHFVAPEFRKKILLFFFRNIKKQEPIINYSDCLVLNAKGAKHWLRVTVSIDYADHKVRTIRLVARDITCEKFDQSSLKASESRFRNLAKQAPVGIIETDQQGEVIFVNDSWLDILGATFEHFKGKAYINVVVPEDRQQIAEEWKQTLDKKAEFAREVRYIHQRTGEMIWALVRFVPVLNSQGDFKGHMGSLADITACKAAEMKIRENEDNLMKLIDNTHAIIWSIDKNKCLLNFNSMFTKACLDSVGKQPEKGQYIFSDNVPLDYSTQWNDVYERVLKGEAFSNEMATEIKGKKAVLENYFHPIIENGQITGATVISREITEKRIAEEKVMRYQQGLKLLNELGIEEFVSYEQAIDLALQKGREYLCIEAGGVAHFFEDGILRIEYLTKKSEDFPLVKGAQKEITKALGSLVYNTKKPVVLSVMEEEHLREFECYSEMGVRAFIAAPIWVSGSLFGTLFFESRQERELPFDDNDESFIQLLSRWISSLLERKAHEENLLKAKERAENASKVKARFLSTMSHEIRTPLNAMMGMSHLLLQEEPRQDQVENLKLLNYSGQNLLSIVNDILDFSKIEADKIELDAIEFNLKELLYNACRSLDFKVAEKDIELDFSYDQQLPHQFKGDPKRIGQIINNLLSNAIKFTDSGSVSLSVQPVAAKQHLCGLRVEVTDTGVGIDEKMQTVIFDQFTQADSDNSRRFEGTGLGLTITKKLLQRMDSEIILESTPGLGSKFWFDLQLPLGDETTPVQPVSDSQRDIIDLSVLNMHILVAEDNKANQLLISRFLNKWGAKVTIAENGKEALDKVQSKQFDMILMDIQMPEMDGLQACQKLRNLDDEYFHKIPVLAISASVLESNINEGLDHGMNDYIMKPFNPKELNHLIFKYYCEYRNELFPFKDQEPKPLGERSEPDSGQKEIILSEDSVDQLRLLITEMTHGDKAFAAELSHLYKLNIIELKERFVQAVMDRERNEASRISHKIYPTLSTLGFLQLIEVIDQIKKDMAARRHKQARLKLDRFYELCDLNIAKLEAINR